MRVVVLGISNWEYGAAVRSFFFDEKEQIRDAEANMATPIIFQTLPSCDGRRTSTPEYHDGLTHSFAELDTSWSSTSTSAPEWQCYP
jgi:hypothetical protein